MIRIILLGPPGSGKGTQADLICRKFFICHISTGEILRQAILKNTYIGIQAKHAIESGQLVPDDIIMNLVKESIASSPCTNGFLLDGFPRNLSQAELLQKHEKFIDFIIYLKISDEIIIERLSGRRYHPGSGRIYHIKYNPPKNVGVDDITGEELIIRPDDQEQIIKKRLLVYHQTTKPIIAWYRQSKQEKFLEVDASLIYTEIFEKIANFVGVNAGIH